MALTKVLDAQFTVATDTGIESYTPDTGIGFVLLAGNPATSMVVDAGTDTVVQPYYVGFEFCFAKINVSASQNDNQKSVMPISTETPTEPVTMGVCVQLQDDGSDQFGYMMRVNNSGTLQLYRVDTGGLSLLDSIGIGTPATGDVLELEIDASGNLTGRYNSVDRVSATDTTYTGGYPGIGLRQASVADGPTSFEGWMEVAAGGPTPLFFPRRMVA